MPVNFKIPASPAIQIYENDTFLGADFTTDEGNIDDTKSPDVVNMIRSIPGKVRKRMGYRQVSDLDGQAIYGVHYYSFANVWIIHAGNKIYQFKGGMDAYWTEHNDNNIITEDDYYMLFGNEDIEHTSDMVLLYTGAAENRSTAYELNQLLVILDGKKMLVVYWHEYDDSVTCCKMEDYPDKTVPIVRISCTPGSDDGAGAGTDYQAFNLLNPRFEQDFLIDSAHATETTLKLYTGDLASEEVEMEVLQSDATWKKYYENTDFYVNRSTGVITFASDRNRDDINGVTSFHYTGGGVTPWGITAAYNTHQIRLTFSGQLYAKNTWDGTITYSCVSGASHTKSIHVEGIYEGYQYWITCDDQIDTYTTHAPGPTPLSGTDNIKVKATYTPTSGNADLINHCRFGVLFGVNGATDRLFVSGNGYMGDDDDGYGNRIGSYSLRNRDWYSDRYDPTYFPDIGYSELGSDTSAIMGYAVVNSYLATFKDSSELSQTVFIREGDLTTTDYDGDQNEETTPTFKLINTLQGAGATSNYCFDYLEVEPIFLSKLGIYSLTSQDITGEKYAQNRSYYLNRKMLKERNLDKAMGFVWRDYYVLCVNNHFYILDGLQPIRTDKSAPYAIRQYVSFYFEFDLEDGENISYIWEMYGFFYFGTTHGRVMRFYKDEKDLKSYNDNGIPIRAKWQTPDISGKLFYKNKTFRYVALKVTPARNSSIIIEGEKNGVWDVIKAEYAKIKYFSFIDFTFARTAGDHPQFTFQCDKTQKVITTKTRIKKVDKVQFRFSNSELNEPLGLNNFALEYTQGGNIK